MRISDQMMTNRMIQYMNDNKEKLAELNNQISSGKLYHNYSENPTQVAASQTIRSTISTSGLYVETANEIDAWMSETDLAFNLAQTSLLRATVLVERGLNDTMSADERANAIAPEVESIIDQLLTSANSSVQGKFIFAGYQVDTKPFARNTINPDVIEYSGDSGIMTHDVGLGQPIVKNINNLAAMNSMFNAAIRAKNALLNNDMTELNASLSDLNIAQQAIGDLQATNGARQRQVSTSIDHLQATNLVLKGLLSDKEDVNMAEAVALLSSQENTYKAVLEVGSRAISALNLFDVLQ